MKAALPVQLIRMADASGPLVPCTTSIQDWLAFRQLGDAGPLQRRACTRHVPFPPSSGATKPKPLVALLPLDGPCISTEGPVGGRGEALHRLRAGLLRPFRHRQLRSLPRALPCSHQPTEPRRPDVPSGPGRYARAERRPGLTELKPAWFSVLACRNASPEPSDNATKPNPLSGLRNHFTVASCLGPNPAEDGQDGALVRGMSRRRRDQRKNRHRSLAAGEGVRGRG